MCLLNRKLEQSKWPGDEVKLYILLPLDLVSKPILCQKVLLDRLVFGHDNTIKFIICVLIKGGVLISGVSLYRGVPLYSQ